MILLLDNYDSFTYNLVDYFRQLNIDVEVRRNDESFDEITVKKYTGVVLSPGPERPETAGRLLDFGRYYLGKLPVLGICLGHQAIGVLNGAELVKARRPMHGKISRISVSQSGVFANMPKQINVVRYHSLVLKNLSTAFEVTAKTEDGEVMAIENLDLKAVGVQFHPEAIMTEYGLQMLRNWVSFYNIV